MCCLALAALLFSSCGADPWGEIEHLGIPIMNGESDTSPEHAAVVALAFGGHLCTGTLITSEVVLTAAHCTKGQQASDYTVIFGQNMYSSNTRSVSEMRVHPRYSGMSIVNDIALLRLATAAPSDVTPIPFLPHRIGVDESDVGTPLEFVGFGKTDTGGVGVKMKVTNDIDWICTQQGGCMIPPGSYIAPNTICQDQEPGGPCFGDSGGPAFIVREEREYVAGVTSYGDQTCSSLGCSTKVDEFEEFIQAFAAGVVGTDCQDAAGCLSGYCVDGTCCETDCAGACMACNLPDSPGVCAPAPDGTPCPDTDKCNGEETCQANECVAGEPVECDDGDFCTRDTCDPELGCRHEPDDCDDWNPCTMDRCDPASGCVHESLRDGVSCGGGLCGEGFCRDGWCQVDSSKGCDDGNACTQNGCDSEGGCLFRPYPDGYECGHCSVCENSECVLDRDCIVVKGTGCGLGAHPGGLVLFALLTVLMVSRKRIAAGLFVSRS
jgi:hypothetical protein